MSCPHKAHVQQLTYFVFAANPCRTGPRLRFWHCHLEDQNIHAPEDWREEDHSGDAAMREIKSLQEQGGANEELCYEDDGLSMAGEDGASSRGRLESNAVVCGA